MQNMQKRGRNRRFYHKKARCLSTVTTHHNHGVMAQHYHASLTTKPRKSSDMTASFFTCILRQIKSEYKTHSDFIYIYFITNRLII